MVDRAISTAVDTVLAVSLVAAAATALLVLAPAATTPTVSPPDAGPALDALAVTTATVNASDGPVTASVATHAVAAAGALRTPYGQAVRAAVSKRLDALPGRARLLVLRNGHRVFAVGPTPSANQDVSAVSLPVENVTLVLRRWWA